MPKELFSYYPPELLPNIKAVRAEYDAAFFSSFPETQVDLSDPGKIDTSLSDFVAAMNNFGVNTFLEGFVKKGFAMPEGKFVLRSVRGRNFRDLGSDRKYGYPEPLWLAVTSFSCGKELNNYYPNPDHVQSPILDARMQKSLLPVILQLQGCQTWCYHYDSEKYTQAVSVLNSFRWEKGLIKLILAWASEENIPAAYLLPGSFNRYVYDFKKNPGFYMRYDVSAQRSGLKLRENGLYGISLGWGYNAMVK